VIEESFLLWFFSFYFLDLISGSDPFTIYCFIFIYFVVREGLIEFIKGEGKASQKLMVAPPGQVG
jgi:hypothetical protein